MSDSVAKDFLLFLWLPLSHLSYTQQNCMYFLCKRFLAHIVSRYDDVNWPPSSCDFMWLFFFFGKCNFVMSGSNGK